MDIAICDDRRADRELLTRYLREELASRRLTCALHAFESGEQMLAAMGEAAYAVNFLDIYMQGMGGVELARRIAGRDPRAAIVFTTTSPDHMAEGFQVGALHYLLKPFTAEAVGEALDRCLRLAGKGERYLELMVNRVPRRVMFSQIMSVESQNRYCLLRARGEVLRAYTRLDDLQAQLDDPRFLRCHRSFVVNMDCVLGVQGNDFVLDDETRVPIRREERLRLKAAFEDYCFEKNRRGL